MGFSRVIDTLWGKISGRKKLTFAERFKCGRGTYGDPAVKRWKNSARLRVGAYCSFADEVTILLGGDHRVDWVTTYPFTVFNPKAKGIPGHPTTRGDVNIGNDVWVGYGATILSGVTIGNGAVIAAMAVVTKDVPPYGIVGGNPAKLIRQRFTAEQVTTLERLAWWDWEEERIDAAFPYLLSGDVAGLEAFAAEPR